MNLSGMNVITNGEATKRMIDHICSLAQQIKEAYDKFPNDDSYVVTEDRIVLNKLADTLAEVRDEYEERCHD